MISKLSQRFHIILNLFQIDDCIDTWSLRSNENAFFYLQVLIIIILVFDLVTTASDFQRLYNTISTNLTKISNNGILN